MSSENKSTGPKEDTGEHQAKPNLLQVVGSVFAAFTGVQSSKNKERDFKHGSHRVFISVALVFTLLFILSIYTVVQIVLNK